jgi:hypothetical protein
MDSDGPRRVHRPQLEPSGLRVGESPGQRHAREEHRRPLRGEEPRCRSRSSGAPSRAQARRASFRGSRGAARTRARQTPAGNGAPSVQGGRGGRTRPGRDAGPSARTSDSPPQPRHTGSVDLERRQSSEGHRAPRSPPGPRRGSRAPTASGGPCPSIDGRNREETTSSPPEVSSSSGRARWTSSTSAARRARARARPPVPSAADHSRSTPIARGVTVRARAPPVRPRWTREPAPTTPSGASSWARQRSSKVAGGQQGASVDRAQPAPGEQGLGLLRGDPHGGGGDALAGSHLGAVEERSCRARKASSGGKLVRSPSGLTAESESEPEFHAGA